MKDNLFEYDYEYDWPEIKDIKNKQDYKDAIE